MGYEQIYYEPSKIPLNIWWWFGQFNKNGPASIPMAYFGRHSVFFRFGTIVRLTVPFSVLYLVKNQRLVTMGAKRRSIGAVRKNGKDFNL